MTEREDNQQEEELSQLRQEVKLSSSKLLDLTYNQNQYVDTLEQYNQQAKNLIQQDELEEALVYLAQAERLLQYGASCGRTIDRALIILTLHNEACCYYKAQDLVTASRYLQGVIFNLKSHLESVDSSPSNSSNSEHPRGSKSNQLASIALEKKMELIHYYLKYCTVNSQAKNRKVALQAGKKIIQVLKSLLPDLLQHKAILSDSSTQGDDFQQLIKSIKPFREEVNLSDLKNYLSLTRHYVKQWNENKVVRKISYGLQKHISNYSISEVIELLPLQYQSENNDTLPNIRSAMRQLLHFSMGYFTISTQYRLTADQLYRNIEEKQVSEQYIRANIYHLLAVLFLALNLPCDLLFMKQIISSYEHHFKTNLLQDVTMEGADELLEKLVYQQTVPIKKKSLNASLAAKLHKLKSKSKQKKVHTQYEDTEMYESKACYKMNQTKLKTKRSTSKQKLLHKVKKPEKILNQSLFDSSKNIEHISKENNKPRAISKKRSTSNAKQLQHPVQISKPRSTSKDNLAVKSLKLPVKIVQMAAVDKPKKANQKRYNDEYQLGKAKCPAKKRSNSIASSADLSCSARDLSKTKNGGDRTKKSQKKRLEGRSKQKKLKQSNKEREVYSKHYYV